MAVRRLGFTAGPYGILTKLAGSSKAALALLGPGSARLFGPIAYDGFDRAAGNLAGTLSPTGHTWSNGAGVGTSTINASGQVVPSGSDYNTIDLGVADYTITMVVTGVQVGGVFPQFCVRYVDVNNHLHLQQQDSTHYLLEKRVAGTYTSVQSIAVSPTVGDVLQIALSGSTVTCKVNGVSQFSGTVSGISTSATKLGFGNAGSNTTGSFDDMTVTL